MKRRKNNKSEVESSLDKMINMLGIHLQQDFAMHQEEMKNERGERTTSSRTCHITTYAHVETTDDEYVYDFNDHAKKTKSVIVNIVM